MKIGKALLSLLGIGAIFGTYLALLFRDDWLMAIPVTLIGMAFLAMAWVGARHVAKHGEEPGEARFDTRNPEQE